MRRALMAWLVVLPVASGAADAGTLVGKLDLPPPPERPPLQIRGFLDRVENALAPVRPETPTHFMVVVLEGQEKPISPPQVTIELLGETFSRKVVAAPDGAEVVIKNVSKVARTLTALEDPKLVPQGPINPTGPKSFRVTEPGKVYTIGDSDAPHLQVTVFVINTAFFDYPTEAGRFEIRDVPPGSYKLKIWYRGGWLDRPDDEVEVGVKGKTEFNPKVAAGAFTPAAKK